MLSLYKILAVHKCYSPIDGQIFLHASFLTGFLSTVCLQLFYQSNCQDLQITDVLTMKFSLPSCNLVPLNPRDLCQDSLLENSQPVILPYPSPSEALRKTYSYASISPKPNVSTWRRTSYRLSANSSAIYSQLPCRSAGCSTHQDP